MKLVVGHSTLEVKDGYHWHFLVRESRTFPEEEKFFRWRNKSKLCRHFFFDREISLRFALVFSVKHLFFFGFSVPLLKKKLSFFLVFRLSSQ